MSLYVGVYAFVILKNGVNEKEEEVIEGLKELVKKKIAAFAVPNAFLVNLISQMIMTVCIYTTVLRYRMETLVFSH